jgi:putative nucleotidyltransferase with HDIG domain
MADEMSTMETADEVGQYKGLGFLLDSKYPLLQEFRSTCPGTFKHSQSLMSMIEGVSIALGIDEEKMKIAALYHDIGKMFAPKYFSENQLENENPHDELDNSVSYQIITRHVSDSVVILINNSDFPREIIEIISQHHGTTLLKYFYNKDKDKESDYKYKTTKPNSIESMVLMVCDSVEATSRALVQAGKFDPDTVINDTLQRAIDSGQLDNVTIKLGDLKKIKSALAKELEGMYQKRIEYPPEEVEDTND